MFDDIRAADRIVLLLNTLVLMAVAFLPFATSVLAGSLRAGEGQRTAGVFYALAFVVTALTFNAVWQYACRHRLLSEALDRAAATAISRRFQFALAWLGSAALLGAVLPIPGVVGIASFNAHYWLPIRGESPGPSRHRRASPRGTVVDKAPVRPPVVGRSNGGNLPGPRDVERSGER